MNIINQWHEGLTLADNNAEPKKDIMLFPFGEFEHPSYGKLKFDNDFFNEIIDNYQNNVLHVKPFMDKQHDEDQALAWFDESPYIRPGMGLFIKPDYTKLGKMVLQNKTYRYFSPSWGKYKDPQSGSEFKNVLMGGAATNIPFLKTMPAIIDEISVLNAKPIHIKLNDLTAKDSSQIGGVKPDEGQEPRKSEVVNKNLSNQKGASMIDKLKEKFGLSADATEETIFSKIDEMVKSNADFATKFEELEKKVDGEKTLSDELNNTKKKLSDVETKLTLKDRDDAIEKALSEGKLLPADREYWEKRFLSDPDNVKNDLEKMPKAVDFSETGKGGEGENKQLSDDPGQQIVDSANKMLSEKKADTFEIAVQMVLNENPKLGAAYQLAY